MSHLEFDPVEGADFRIAMQPPQGDVFHIRGTFRLVEAPSRLSFTFAYVDQRSGSSGGSPDAGVR